MKAKPQKVQAQEESSTTSLTTSTTTSYFLIVSNKFPSWTQVESTKSFQISKELDHKHSFIGILCHKTFFLEFGQGKQPRSFDMANAWWTINNFNCGIDVNIKNMCCNNYTQIAKIQPIKRFLINII
jgi:hypothetical protein